MFFRFLTLISALFLVPSWCSTFTMNPWILIFEPDKNAISQVVDFQYRTEGTGQSDKAMGPVANDGLNEPKPIEISISARELTLEGAIVYPSSQGADDFVVYPSQFILYPGDTKKVQVQWVGAKTPEKEISMGIIATQLPLTIKEKKEKPKRAVAQVEMMTRYEGIIVVRPSKVAPKVIVDTAYAHNDSLGTHLEIILNNIGTGLQSLKAMDLTVAPLDKNGKIDFSQKIQIKNPPPSTATTQSLMAGYRRKVEVPWPAGFPVVPVKVMVVFPIVPK